MEENLKDSEVQEEITIIRTDENNKDGQNKCPKCGSTDVSLNINNGKLRCNFCRHEFEPEKAIGVNDDIRELKGKVVGSGASNIKADVKDILTFKCSSCGAEVVIDTNEALQSRCHWCRNTLSVNQQIENGSVPDMVLPFKISKENAKIEIEKFVKKRKFFAHPKFKEEFCSQNVMGVYLPYMVVDINAHSTLMGQGEILIKKYFRGSGKNQKTYYDADLYEVGRDYDIMIDDLTIESSSDKLQHNNSNKTTNIINAIMPFDTDNCVRWDANYLKGYTSEKRDSNIDQLKNLVEIQAKDISRHKANDFLKQYNRGINWTKEELNIKGEKWKAAYLPVWLYSYQQIISSKKQKLHYVAVNARNQKVMGSIPINMPKLLGISAIVEVIGLLFWWVIFIDWDYGWAFILLGFIYFFIYFNKYRNSKARHKHQKDTKTIIENMKEHDKFIERRTGLRNSKINGANNTSVSNDKSNKLMDNFVDQNPLASFIKENIEKK